MGKHKKLKTLISFMFTGFLSTVIFLPQDTFGNFLKQSGEVKLTADESLIEVEAQGLEPNVDNRIEVRFGGDLLDEKIVDSDSTGKYSIAFILPPITLAAGEESYYMDQDGRCIDGSTGLPIREFIIHACGMCQHQQEQKDLKVILYDHEGRTFLQAVFKYQPPVLYQDNGDENEAVQSGRLIGESFYSVDAFTAEGKADLSVRANTLHPGEEYMILVVEDRGNSDFKVGRIDYIEKEAGYFFKANNSGENILTFPFDMNDPAAYDVILLRRIEGSFFRVEGVNDDEPGQPGFVVQSWPSKPKSRFEEVLPAVICAGEAFEISLNPTSLIKCRMSATLYIVREGKKVKEGGILADMVDDQNKDIFEVHLNPSCRNANIFDLPPHESGLLWLLWDVNLDGKYNDDIDILSKLKSRDCRSDPACPLEGTVLKKIPAHRVKTTKLSCKSKKFVITPNKAAFKSTSPKGKGATMKLGDPAIDKSPVGELLIDHLTNFMANLPPGAMANIDVIGSADGFEFDKEKEYADEIRSNLDLGTARGSAIQTAIGSALPTLQAGVKVEIEHSGFVTKTKGDVYRYLKSLTVCVTIK